LIDEQPVGVIGLERPNGEHFLSYSWATLRSEFNRWDALWRYGWIQFSHWFQRPGKNDLRIEAVAVAENMRGQGIGKCLIEHVCRLAMIEGYQGVVLEVVDTNPRARELYERLGFVLRRSDQVGFVTRSAGFAGVNYMRKPL
jgi:ribosomal protein S18 acetylase RimI-like enzyme